EYKHHVFRQYGSGTFSGADTYLLDTFMVNIDELLKEKKFLEEIYGIDNKIYIDRRCRITLPMDILMNRLLEDKRTNKHGSCGLGIYETFHRNNEIEYITIRDIVQEYISVTPVNFRYKLLDRAKAFYKLRLEDIYENEGIEITEGEYEELINKTDKMNLEFIKNLSILGIDREIIFVDSLENILNKYNYNDIIFECSQGLELDQFNKRNWPHLTPSNTGLLNVSKELKNNKHLENAYIEVCFVSRSYKTKHGAGEFFEEDSEIQNQYGLYDRTNQPNQYQGTLRYGKINIGRMKKLMVEQLNHVVDIKNINVGLAITHLDQTNGLILTCNDTLTIDEAKERFRGLMHNYYFSFGEKSNDIIKD
ncbi:MAG: adenylosuccinate synthetase, partial [Lachnospiraceae bacterium]|nr:adenylosuccinate synthetase [Lachnospiraceae bacterium]